MATGEAQQYYAAALKAGQKCYREAVLKGEYPYPQVLDEIFDEHLAAGRVELGTMNIPMDQIVGTKSQGRRNAFASNFMPLLPMETEFGMKWLSLCEANLSSEGIRDPIRCYEYLGRFYVQEGNKRVSVLRAFDSPSIAASVVRIIPVWSEEEEIRVYYEFMEFYALSKLYRVRFSRPGQYRKLQAALGLINRLVVGILFQEFLSGGDVVVFAGHHSLLFLALTFLKLLLETVQQRAHHGVVPCVLTLVAVNHGLACGLSVDAEILLQPALVDVLADGIGCRVVEVFQLYRTVHVVHLLLLLVGSQGLVQRLLCFLVELGFLFEHVVVGLAHSHLAAFDFHILCCGGSHADSENCQ